MYLLDTHTLLWYLNDSEQLSDTARNLINCEKNISVSIEVSRLLSAHLPLTTNHPSPTTQK